MNGKEAAGELRERNALSTEVKSEEGTIVVTKNGKAKFDTGPAARIKGGKADISLTNCEGVMQQMLQPTAGEKKRSFEK